MAPLSPAALLHSLFRRDDDAGVGSSCDGVNGPCIEVVCAWPLSGQYGFGQRILYYILVVVCVVARKEEWIRAVCQAAALLVPAVAAIHGIVLASMHVDGATDMDIYGALQFCSIGILAAPVTVKLSSTFFYDPGRNIIFLWTGLILSGLLSLAVEFYRSNTHPCATGNSLIPSLRKFPYGEEDLCGLVCSEDHGPFSSLRQGATSEIYVVPKPSTLPFGMAMFLAAAECVPAILSLVSIWKRGRGSRDKEQIEDQAIIPGTNGATFRGMKDVNQAIRSLLSAVEVPVFGGAWLAVLIIGEINFWSPQVNYHTEPISNIGQWGTILGTGMAGLGSLYVWLADSNGDLANPTTTHCSCPHCHGRGPPDGVLTDEASPRASAAHREFQERAGSEAGLSIATSTGEWVPRRKIANALERLATTLVTQRRILLVLVIIRLGNGLEFQEKPIETARWPNTTTGIVSWKDRAARVILPTAARVVTASRELQHQRRPLRPLRPRQCRFRLEREVRGHTPTHFQRREQLLVIHHSTNRGQRRHLMIQGVAHRCVAQHLRYHRRLIIDFEFPTSII
ncbi:hypothetical protein CKAH01_11253 [Colletotrichum kahawae]|uniref:Uncharacterized protein n=1 Tax=Colletotrichum kahawae TaxID=34407 RepID=A0AAD9XUN6_COLKA|nr:hypothetical protein CKAH01_11253 [Colletotrichum kahawae]